MSENALIISSSATMSTKENRVFSPFQNLTNITPLALKGFINFFAR